MRRGITGRHEQKILEGCDEFNTIKYENNNGNKGD